MGQVRCPCRIASSDGTFLEMSFEDVAAAEGLVAQVTLVRSLAGVWSTATVNMWNPRRKKSAQTYVADDAA